MNKKMGDLRPCQLSKPNVSDSEMAKSHSLYLETHLPLPPN